LAGKLGSKAKARIHLLRVSVRCEAGGSPHIALQLLRAPSQNAGFNRNHHHRRGRQKAHPTKPNRHHSTCHHDRSPPATSQWSLRKTPQHPEADEIHTNNPHTTSTQAQACSNARMGGHCMLPAPPECPNAHMHTRMRVSKTDPRLCGVNALACSTNAVVPDGKHRRGDSSQGPRVERVPRQMLARHS
jgi:hypothetical protein